MYKAPCSDLLDTCSEDQVGREASCSGCLLAGLGDRHPRSPVSLSPNCFLKNIFFNHVHSAMEILEISSLPAPRPVAVTGTRFVVSLIDSINFVSFIKRNVSPTCCDLTNIFRQRPTALFVNNMLGLN